MASKFSLPFSCIFFFLLLLPHISLSLSHPEGSRGNNKNSLSAFDFIRHLQGCHKGQKVKDLHELKLYLSRFGYLNYQHDPNHKKGQDDEFDEELEAALKTYQLYYHLNATGTLDKPTVSKMVMPRCGQPDKRNHQHGSNSLHTVSHYQFIQGNPKWPVGKSHLTYAFVSGYRDQYIPPVVMAFNKWASASQYFTFSRVGDFGSADLKISFGSRDHGDGSPFDGPGGVLAHAFSPTDGRFHYDGDENWSIGAVPNTFDLETLALHEIGHLLGLDHSENENAIMWGSFAAGVVKGLHGDDVQGIKALYYVN